MAPQSGGKYVHINIIINIFAVVILPIKIHLSLNFCVKDTLICNITLHNPQIDC